MSSGVGPTWLADLRLVLLLGLNVFFRAVGTGGGGFYFETKFFGVVSFLFLLKVGEGGGCPARPAFFYTFVSVFARLGDLVFGGGLGERFLFDWGLPSAPVWLVVWSRVRRRFQEGSFLTKENVTSRPGTVCGCSLCIYQLKSACASLVLASASALASIACASWS